MAFANAENDLRKLFSGCSVVEECPSGAAVTSSVPSQRHTDPPVCAALILSACAVASFSVSGGWYCLACWGSPFQPPW